MLSSKFLNDMKSFTENMWASEEPSTKIYGYQISKGTKWLAGMSIIEIDRYEKLLGFPFPEDLKTFFSFTKGFDLMETNTYANEGTPFAYLSLFHTFPEHIETIKDMIEKVSKNKKEIIEDLLLDTDVNFLPLYSHRYVICSKDKSKSAVASIMDTDAIIYADSLGDYLIKEFNLQTSNVVKLNGK